MDDDGRSGERLGLSHVILAGLGAAATGVEALDELADDLARRLGVDRDAARASVRDTIASWREEAERLGGRHDEAIERVVERLGVVRRAEVEDLQLRMAQLEHRVRLLERDSSPARGGDPRSGSPPCENP